MKVLLIFAHPDDETIGVGGTSLLLSRAGYQIKVVTATRGEAGQTGGLKVDPKELGRIREVEARNAAKITGISELTFLGYMDGALEKVPDQELIDKILPILSREKPDIVITFEKMGISNHPDHKKISKVTTEAFEKYVARTKKTTGLYYVTIPTSQVRRSIEMGIPYDTFGGLRGTPDEKIDKVVDISKVYKTKLKAFREHKSQVEDYKRYIKWAKKMDMKKEHFLLSQGEDLLRVISVTD